MTFAKVKKYDKVIASILLVVLYLIYWPYNSTGGDMIEIMPALKKMHFPNLYPRDFYLNFNSTLGFHERSFYLYFLHYIGGIHAIVLFTLYLFCLFFFCFGLISLTNIFNGSIGLQFILALIILVPLKYTAVGANELFYAMPTPAILSKTLGLWSIYFFLRDRKWTTYFLLILSAYFHILVGVQLFILIGISDVMLNFNKKSLHKIILPPFFFTLLVIPYVLLLFYNRLSPHAHGNSLIDLIEFRIGHHFFIQYSGILSIVFLATLYVLGLILWRFKEKFIYYFICIQFTLLLVYLVLGNWLRIDFFIQFQWLKTSIWIELFATIGLVLWLYENYREYLSEKTLRIVGCGLMTGVIIASFFTQKEDKILLKEEEKLALWTKNNTDTNALFMYPPLFTRFKAISERSSWIDYKAISHQIAYLIPWYDRVNKIFGIDLDDRRHNINLIKKANVNFENINDHNLTFLLYSQNVNYIILPTKNEPSEYMFPAYSTDHYTIYQRKELN